MLSTAFGESTMNKTRIYEWYKRFQNSHEDIEDADHMRHSSKSTTDENEKSGRNDRERSPNYN